ATQASLRSMTASAIAGVRTQSMAAGVAPRAHVERAPFLVFLRGRIIFARAPKFMDHFLIVTIPLLWLVSIACCWLGWQLLRQNGRMLLRLDEIEKRLEELEFGEPDVQSNGSHSEESDQSLVT